jgi:hypothetical protein
MRRNIAHSLAWMYRLLLRLYPADFRQEFGDEMAAIFSEAITEVAQRKPYDLLIFCGRELRDYLFSLLREHRRTFNQGEPHLMATLRKKVTYLFVLILVTLLWRLLAGYLWGFRETSEGGILMLLIAYWPLVLALLIWPSALALGHAAGRLDSRVWFVAGLFFLAILCLPVSLIVALFPDHSLRPFGSPPLVVIFSILSLPLVVAAMLFRSGLKLYRGQQPASKAARIGALEQWRQDGRAAVLTLALSALLLVKMLHTIYWLTVWDNTYDSLGYIWLVFPILAALFSGLLLSISLPNREKWTGVLYALLMPALMIGVSAQAQRVDFRQLTEKRAERVNQAIETYYARNGRYPQELQQLTPWTILSLSRPIIIYGQGWCYDGGADYYRLGYIYRDHWSDPRLRGRIYAAQGTVADLQPVCREEVAAIQRGYPRYPYSYEIHGE